MGFSVRMTPVWHRRCCGKRQNRDHIAHINSLMQVIQNQPLPKETVPLNRMAVMLDTLTSYAGTPDGNIIFQDNQVYP
jgi:hypothetical protein